MYRSLGLGLVLLLWIDTASGGLVQCCAEGRRHYKQSGYCANVHVSRGGSACLRSANVCCLRAAFESKCLVGERRAKNEASCAVVRLDQLAGGVEKECCECCLLAQDLAQDGKPCQPLNTFGGLCRRAFERCCDSPPANRLAYTSAQTASFSNSAPNRCYPSNQCEQLCEDYGELNVKCNCWPGYTLHEDGESCQDIDECADDGANDCVDHTERCLNTPGSYQCTPISPAQHCPVGYKYEDGRCTDADECAETPGVCQASTQTCLNTVGSYQCQCREGYSTNGDGKCVDVNECMLQKDNCQYGQRCINTPGSYKCIRTLSCGTGYYLDSDTEDCVDVDECALGTHNCGATFVCRNTQGSFRCEIRVCPERQVLDKRTGNCTVVQCAPGFAPDPQGKCEDVNECGRADACGAHRQCVNTPGSYYCRDQPNYCGNGYKVDQATGGCVDVDECGVGTHTCGTGQTCVNTDGGFKCACPTGFTFNTNSRQCDDIDECGGAYGARVCPYESECRNSIGSYTCLCQTGYQQGRDNHSCVDVDECATGTARCDQRCVNVPGSYHCVCDRGYTIGVDGSTCRDIDECSLWGSRGANLCMGRCINTAGSYTCHCPTGYQLSADGRACDDIDECKQGQCRGPDRICVNTLGGFKCHHIVCPDNFVKDNQFKNRCNRASPICLAGDTICASTPLSISHNYIALPNKLKFRQFGLTSLPLFTMKGPRLASTSVQFELVLTDAAPLKASLSPATRNSFLVQKGREHNSAVVALSEPLDGPQDVHLDLLMRVQHGAVSAGRAVAKLVVHVSDLVEDGYMCRKQCSPRDPVCLANGTHTISYQYAALPTLRRLTQPVRVARVTAHSLDHTPFYVTYTIHPANAHKFTVQQDQRIGTVYLKSPIVGPSTELVRLHMNVYSRNNVMIAHNVALISVYVSGQPFLL